MDNTKVVATEMVAADSCGVCGSDRAQTGARRYGECAPFDVRERVRRHAELVGVPQAARDLRVTTGALARTIAGLQQAPGTINRIAASLVALTG